MPFISDTDLRAQLAKDKVPPQQADAVLKANSDARLGAVRDASWVVAFLAVAGMFCTGLIPTEPVGQRAGTETAGDDHPVRA